MKRTTKTNDALSLERLFQAGNQRAAAWSEPVAGSWEPESSRREVRRFAIVLVTGAVLVGLLARYVLSADAPTSPAPVAVEPSPAREARAVAAPITPSFGA